MEVCSNAVHTCILLFVVMNVVMTFRHLGPVSESGLCKSMLNLNSGKPSVSFHKAKQLNPEQEGSVKPIAKTETTDIWSLLPW